MVRFLETGVRDEGGGESVREGNLVRVLDREICMQMANVDSFSE